MSRESWRCEDLRSANLELEAAVGEREVKIRLYTIERMGRADKDNELSMSAGQAVEPYRNYPIRTSSHE